MCYPSHNSVGLADAGPAASRKEDAGLNPKNNKPSRPDRPNKNMMGIASIILWALVFTLFINYLFSSYSTSKTVEVSYSEFRQMILRDEVARVDLTANKYVITLKDGIEQPAWSQKFLDSLTEEELQRLQLQSGHSDLPALDGATRELTKTTYYCAPLNDDTILDLMEEHDVDFRTPYQEELSPIVSFLVSWILPMVVMVGLFYFLFRNMGSRMGGGLGGVGKANAKVYVEKQTGVTFNDVAGQDEAKESMQEIIDILHNPGKYTEIGAKLPKGALLVGPPGTGKTLLAKAVAGEAGVPFFSISGSDFVEMFVGVGASRVRDLFKEAAKMAPCIIFIDEIDTIGKSRDNRLGGNDEREQTLNQLLAELDGFDPTKGVIVLAATNRPEVLDKALLRPGRFDRRITIDRPNLAGRLKTLQVHTRGIRLAEDVNLNKIAQATAGAVGADLANLVNEAALRAVRLGRRTVNQNDLLVSFEVVIAGTEKKGSVLTEREKKLVAFHEVGHALVAAKQKNAQPVSKITIVPHTQGALGYTLHLPEEEKYLMDKEEILAEIRCLLAGRAAEEVVFQTQTSGAANDIERATDMARKLITMYGMSEKYGMMSLATIQNQYLEGGYGLTCAQETAAGVDGEILKIINACHADAVKILQDNREMLDKIAQYLLNKETITGAEMMAILEGRDPALADNYGATPEPSRSLPDVEPPAKRIHMTSEPIPVPPPADPPAQEPTPSEEPEPPEEQPKE